MHERDKRAKRHHADQPPQPAKPRKSLIMQTPVLVLNASYEPINICAARRAITSALRRPASSPGREPVPWSGGAEDALAPACVLA